MLSMVRSKGRGSEDLNSGSKGGNERSDRQNSGTFCNDDERVENAPSIGLAFGVSGL